jgi:hypothetical protein
MNGVSMATAFANAGCSAAEASFHEFRPSLRSFKNCPRLPHATPFPFAAFNNRYAGQTCCIVGRGPTTFQYSTLANIAEPIFFINDAICLEKYVRSESFFFAHDRELRVWLDGSVRSTAVLPTDGTVLGEDPGLVLGHSAPVVYYRRGEKDKRDLLQMSREALAAREQLYVHSGTIHSVLHFVWFCGFTRVAFIGCDGLNQKADLARAGASPEGYDPRLENRSQSAPLWQYARIRLAQDLLTKLFGIEAIYLGTPCAHRV